MTKDIRDAIIIKQDELIKSCKDLILKVKKESIFSYEYWNKILKLESELASLKAELEKEKIPVEIDFSEWGIPNEPIIEYAFMPSGRIVVMDKDDSFWFEKDGTNNKDGRISRIIWKLNPAKD